MNLKQLSDYNKIIEFAETNSIDFVALYGSYYYGKASENSDIDLIIDKTGGISSEELDLYKNSLQQVLEKKVDIITPELMISSPLCGYVWRLKEYEILFGDIVIEEYSQ